jgi:hypothetical protein
MLDVDGCESREEGIDRQEEGDEGGEDVGGEGGDGRG